MSRIIASSICIVLVVTTLWFTPSASAQYSKNGSDSSKQGNFVNRSKDDSAKKTPDPPSKPAPTPSPAPTSSPNVAPRPAMSSNAPRSQWELEREQWERQQQWERDQMNRDRWQREQDARRNSQNDRGTNYPPNSFVTDANRAFTGTGTITSARQGLIQVSAEGSTWQVRPETGAKIEVLGVAGPDYLKPGQLVKYRALFDLKATDQKKAIAPITALEIITARPGEMPGAVPVAAEEAGAAVPESARWLQIIGRIKTIKNGEMGVDSGNGIFQTQLDPATAIKLRVADYTLARQGDQIEASGRVTNPGLAIANKIAITLARPLGNPLSNFPAAKAPAKAAETVDAKATAKADAP